MKSFIYKYLEKFQKHSDLVFVFLLICILSALILPLPPLTLDILLTLSITFSLVALFVTIYIKHPLEFTVFPSLLLLLTLFRLSLNVATTRRILLYGQNGPDAVSEVIKSFGNFVVQGNILVGLIIFIIFIIINYMVITKGTERIAEVAARFTLDAMPGKQMAIDADLNAGFIDEKEAQRRREQLVKEADFYGAMDGATKFIRGDAIAGFLITAINLIGGIAVGILQHGLSFSQALKTYTVLTVGDGLVSQIPSLITSVAAGFMVTRSASQSDLGTEIATQLSSYPKALVLVAFILFIIALVPGMPKIPFITLALIVATIAYLSYMTVEKKEKEVKEKEIKKAMTQVKKSPETIIVQPDPLALEIGTYLIHLVDEKAGGELLNRIKNLRYKIAKELGLIIPLVHIRDSFEIDKNEYRILIKGVEVARYRVYPGKYLAINLGGVKDRLDKYGKVIPTKEPAFNLEAYWIDPTLKEKAKALGYTVVDVSNLIITHLQETIKQHAADLLTRVELQKILDGLSKRYPVVNELIGEGPGKVPITILHRVCQNLLQEQIPINDMITIIETLADILTLNQNVHPDLLTEEVRKALSKVITKKYAAPDGSLNVVVLDPLIENIFIDYITKKTPLSPELMSSIINQLRKYTNEFYLKGLLPVLLVSRPEIRKLVRDLIKFDLPNWGVMSAAEIAPGTKVNIIGKVSYNGQNKGL